MIKELNWYCALCITDIYGKYAWVAPLKDQESITITINFQKVLNDTRPKPNKICEDKASEFYYRLMKSKENLLSLKDLLEPYKLRSTSIWLQYQKMYIQTRWYI